MREAPRIGSASRWLYPGGGEGTSVRPYAAPSARALATLHDVSDWDGVRLHVVSGKGGTGKSTVASALALALAGRGRNVLLCEVEGRQGIARMFDVEPLPYSEQRLTTGLPDADGGRGVVHALHIDAEAALLEYLSMYYRLGRAGRALDRFGVTEFATTIAPGVRDVLLTGKVYEAVERNSRNKGAIRYDAVVLDAPPTGRITQFLNVSNELAGLAKVGPIKAQADTMMTLFRSPRTAVHLVTVLEEMPVQETADGIAELRAARLPVGGVIVNQVRPQDLSADALAPARAGTLDRARIESDLTSTGLKVTPGLVDGLLAEAADHAERRALEDSQRALVAELGQPTYELPRLPGGIDLGGLYELAGMLRAQGMA
ncbi:ArsA family ATPase [Nocardioides sp. zg-536]|uniref:ArsA family ATPase n=1 Tax=Nocardioides faecalis TaxID=2803858 RepID=A0A938YAB9_9ACTN|nr:ArsA family ATPase [Nocardioides faecalis]QVI59099.1 ArsA family ATPase [Nocardioides faecalis]